MTQHPYDEIEAFALGDLDEVSARRVLEHADACPSCAVLLAQSLGGVAALARGDGERPIAAPASKFLARTGSAGVRKRLGPAALVTGMAAALAALLVWNVNLRSAQPEVPIDALVHSHFLHHSLSGGPGSAKVLLANDGSWFYIVGDGLPARAHYQVTEIRAGRSVKAGSMNARSDGRVTVFWPQAPGPIDGVKIVGPNGASLHWP